MRKFPRKHTGIVLGIAVLAVCVWVIGPKLRQVGLDAALIGRVKRGDVTGVRSLLASGASPDAVDIAASAWWQKIAQRRGQDDHPHHEDPRALHVALYAIYEEPIPAENSYQIIETLLDAGANTETKARDGDTPLMIAIWAGDPKFVKLFLQRGANVNARNGYGVTPLMNTAGGGDAAMVRLLTTQGADLNGQDNYGCTPLHHAITYGNEAGVRALIELGADVNLRDKGHVSPLASAQSYQTKIVKMLKDAGAR